MAEGQLSTSRKYVHLKKTLDQRHDYLERAILAIETARPVAGGSQDDIIVSREAMAYVLERAKDAVEIAQLMNETIQSHNLNSAENF